MTVLSEKERSGGVQIIHKFDNNYGASVIQHEFSYGADEGLWELAVIKFTGDCENYELCYDTEITGDVLGYLSDSDVEELLNKIEDLDK